MVAGPGLLVVVTVLLVVVLVATVRLRESRDVVRRDARAAPCAGDRPARREAAVREARRRLEQRVLETHLTTSDLVVPRQRPLRGH